MWWRIATSELHDAPDQRRADPVIRVGRMEIDRKDRDIDATGIVGINHNMSATEVFVAVVLARALDRQMIAANADHRRGTADPGRTEGHGEDGKQCG